VPLLAPYNVITDDIRPSRCDTVPCLVLTVIVMAGVSLGLAGLILWLMKVWFDWLEARAKAQRNDQKLPTKIL